MKKSNLNRRSRETVSYFRPFARNYTSQHGEDGILQEVFSLIGLPGTPFCIDVGAWDGKHLSNTFSLLNSSESDGVLAKADWGGILFEADPSRFHQLQELYVHHKNVTCVHSLVCLEGPNSLSNQLSSHGAPKNADLLSIDIDGCDYYLWKEAAENGFLARVVVIEFNPTIPNHVFFVQEKNIAIQQGSSLLAMQELGSELGYTLIATTVFNAIFLRNDLMPAMPASVRRDPTLDSMHSPTMTTDIFQTYDGELKILGTKKLLWHKVAINPQRLQVIPKKARHFPFAPSNGWTRQLDACERAAESLVRSLEPSPAMPSSGMRRDTSGMEWQREGIIQGPGQEADEFIRLCGDLLPICCLQGLVLEVVVRTLATVEGAVEEREGGGAVGGRLTDIRRQLRLAIALLFEGRGDQADSGGDGEDEGWFRLALTLASLELSYPPQESSSADPLVVGVSAPVSVAVRGPQLHPDLEEEVLVMCIRLSVKVARSERIKGGVSLWSAAARLNEASNHIRRLKRRTDSDELIQSFYSELDNFNRKKCSLYSNNWKSTGRSSNRNCFQVSSEASEGCDGGSYHQNTPQENDFIKLSEGNHNIFAFSFLIITAIVIIQTYESVF